MMLEVGREYIRFDEPEVFEQHGAPQKRGFWSGWFRSSRRDGRPTPEQLRYRPAWQSDADYDLCCHAECDQGFSLLHRRHHCRACGYIYCSAHTKHRIDIVKMGYYNVRACPLCTRLLSDEEQAVPPETLAGRVNAILEGGFGSFMCSSTEMSDPQDLEERDGVLCARFPSEPRGCGADVGERIWELETLGSPTVPELPAPSPTTSSATAVLTFPSRSPSCSAVPSREPSREPGKE